MKTIETIIAIILLAVASVAAIAALDGCRPGWNDPTPIIKESGNPCGLDWHSCHNGKCCADDSECRPNGGCAWGGLQGPTWGSVRDGGGERARPQLTPEEVKATPR
jgi:hypothetical protein